MVFIEYKDTRTIFTEDHVAEISCNRERQCPVWFHDHSVFRQNKSFMCMFTHSSQGYIIIYVILISVGF